MRRSRGGQEGFTLIEVMIAVLVLGVGLLGFALLQVNSLRMSQSANYRTQATNLATELLDQMRSNRLSAAAFAAQATFAKGSRSGNPCAPATGSQNVSAMAELWKCQVVRALGDNAGATVTYQGNVVQVTLVWGERTQAGDDPEETSFEVRSRL